MKTYSLLTALLLLLSGCSGGVDGDPIDTTDDDRVTTDSDDGDHDAQDNAIGDGDSSPADGDGCPAPALTAKQVEIYGESFKSNWVEFSFGPDITQETSNVCSGSKARKFSDTDENSGFGFSTSGSAVATVHLSVRVWVSSTSRWTIAAKPPSSANAHCYRLPFPDLCNGEDTTCGHPSQPAAPCILEWTEGWNDVELNVPSGVGTVDAIFFERQLSSGLSGDPVTLILDDLRLTNP